MLKKVKLILHAFNLKCNLNKNLGCSPVGSFPSGYCELLQLRTMKVWH